MITEAHANLMLQAAEILEREAEAIKVLVSGSFFEGTFDPETKHDYDDMMFTANCLRNAAKDGRP